MKSPFRKLLLPLMIAAHAQAAERIEEVIVTARKKDETLHDIPLTVNAFSTDQLQERGIESLENLAGFTPGFDFAQAFGRQDFRPAIRGQSNIQGGANAGLFIDGSGHQALIERIDQ